MSEDIYHPRRRTVTDPNGVGRTKKAPARKVDLGAVADFPELPARVRLDNGEEHWLAKARDGQYRLMSMICPHAYGRVVKWDRAFCVPTRLALRRVPGHLRKRAAGAAVLSRGRDRQRTTGGPNPRRYRPIGYPRTAAGMGDPPSSKLPLVSIRLLVYNRYQI